MAKIIEGKVIRTCRVCKTNSNIVKFLLQKCSKSGNYYTHNICIPCRREYNYQLKYKNISKEEHSKRAQKWNTENKEKYNARRRKKSWLFNNTII